MTRPGLVHRKGLDMAGKMTHVGADGGPRMVDVSAKRRTRRTAVAAVQVHLSKAAATLLASSGCTTAKGNVFECARLAGIMAAKRTGELIPLCHNLPLEHVDVKLALDGCVVRITATARATAKTGVEMEALTACAVAALTVYDMCKSIDKGIRIRNLGLVSKTGGKSGKWTREQDE